MNLLWFFAFIALVGVGPFMGRYDLERPEAGEDAASAERPDSPSA